MKLEDLRNNLDYSRSESERDAFWKDFEKRGDFTLKLYTWYEPWGYNERSIKKQYEYQGCVTFLEAGPVSWYRGPEKVWGYGRESNVREIKWSNYSSISSFMEDLEEMYKDQDLVFEGEVEDE